MRAHVVSSHAVGAPCTTIREIAAALGLTKRAAEIRASKRSWPYTTQSNRQRLYAIPQLPPEVRLSLAEHMLSGKGGHHLSAKAQLKSELKSGAADVAVEAGLARLPWLDDLPRRRAEARAALVRLCDEFIRTSGLAQSQGRELFAHHYNKGEVVVDPWISSEVVKISGSSLANWAKALRAQGITRLAGRHGRHRKGSGKIDGNPALYDLVVGMLTDYPHTSAKLVMRALTARFDAAELPSYRSVQRWIASWKQTHAQVHAAISNPDRWRGKYQAAGGNASANVTRLNKSGSSTPHPGTFCSRTAGGM